MKAVVAAFNQEKALVGAFSVITNLRMELFQALVFTVRTNIQATLVMSITRIITSPSITHYHHIPFQQRKQRWFPVPDKCLRSTLSTLTMKQSSQMQEQRTLQKTEYWQGCDFVRHRPGWSWRLVLWLWWQQDDIWTMNAVNSRVLQFWHRCSSTLEKALRLRPRLPLF